MEFDELRQLYQHFLGIKSTDSINSPKRIFLFGEENPSWEGTAYYKKFILKNGRPIIYFIEKHTRPFYWGSDEWRVTINVDRAITKFICDLESHFNGYDYDSVELALKTSAPIIADYICKRKYKGYIGVEVLHVTLSFEINQIYMTLEQNELCEEIADRIAGVLVDMYYHLIEEAKTLSIDSERLVKLGKANGLIEKIILTAGTLAVRYIAKAVVKSIGSDISFNDNDAIANIWNGEDMNVFENIGAFDGECGESFMEDSSDLANGLSYDDSYDIGSQNISFGANGDSYLQKQLDKAYDNVEYYTKQLRRDNISTQYRVDCQFKLREALEDVKKYTKELTK